MTVIIHLNGLSKISPGLLTQTLAWQVIFIVIQLSNTGVLERVGTSGVETGFVKINRKQNDFWFQFSFLWVHCKIER